MSGDKGVGYGGVVGGSSDKGVVCRGGEEVVCGGGGGEGIVCDSGEWVVCSGGEGVVCGGLANEPHDLDHHHEEDG